MNARGEAHAGWARAWLAPAGAAAGAVAAVLGASTAAVALGGPDWLLGAVTSRPFVACEAVLVGCAGALGAIAGFLWRAGRPQRRHSRAEHGEAIIEFALAMPFVAMLSLLMAQASFLMVGNACVHYSAYCAARAACVAVPLTLSGEPRNVVAAGAAGGKMQRIRLAAAWALMPTACGSESYDPAGAGDVEGLAAAALVPGLRTFFGALPQRIAPEESYRPAGRGGVPAWVDDRLVRKLCYAADPAYTAVELAPPADANGYQVHEDLRTTVRHKLFLSVPYAARIFAAFPGGVQLGFGGGECATEITASCTMPNEGAQDYVDVEKFPP